MKRSQVLSVALMGALTCLRAELVAQEKIPVSTPTFRSASDALAWGQERLQEAQGGSSRSLKSDLLNAAAAFREARMWKGAGPSLRRDAVIGEAEAFLQLSAPKNALMAIDSLPRADQGVRAALLVERAGEAGEMMGSRSSALAAYDRALRLANVPAERSLATFRAGVVAFHEGRMLLAVSRLEEVASGGSKNAGRTRAAIAFLAESYARMKDHGRAEAWLSAGKSALGMARQASSTELRSFLPEPSDAEIAALLAKTERSLATK